MRVRCGPGFLLLLALLALMDGGEAVLPWAALAAAVHELGHYAAVRLQGGAVKELRLSLSGGALVLDRRRPLSYAGELAAILSGPGASLLLAQAAARLGDGGEGSSLLAGLSVPGLVQSPPRVAPGRWQSAAADPIGISSPRPGGGMGVPLFPGSGRRPAGRWGKPPLERGRSDAPAHGRMAPAVPKRWQETGKLGLLFLRFRGIIFWL